MEEKRPRRRDVAKNGAKNVAKKFFF